MKKLVYSSLTSGFVGIWWLYNDTVISDLKTLDDGYNDGNYIQYDETKNHMTEWNRLVKGQVPNEADTLIPQGYKSIERGRVIYNLRTMSYEVTCSKNIFYDSNARELIKNAFNLNGCRYDFVILNHYHIAKLTGNPALDQFEYEV